MDREEFAEWLVENGLAERERGYGHATGWRIADELFDAGFTIEAPLSRDQADRLMGN